MKKPEANAKSVPTVETETTLAPVPSLSGKRLAVLASCLATPKEKPSVSVARAVEIWNAAHAFVDAQKIAEGKIDRLSEELTFQEIFSHKDQKKLLPTLKGTEEITTVNGVRDAVRVYLEFILAGFDSVADQYFISPEAQQQWKNRVEVACERIKLNRAIPSTR